MSEADGKSPPWMRYATVLIVTLAVLICVGFLFAVYVPVTANYAANAEFEAMPADDVELLKWAAQQPGIVAQSVIIQRQQGGAGVRIQFRMTRPILGKPEPPDWHKAFEELGYTIAAE